MSPHLYGIRFSPLGPSGAVRRAPARTAIFLASTSVLLIGNGPVRADEIIDGGDTVTIPGTHPTPWSAGSLLTIGATTTGTLIIQSGGVVTSGRGTIGNAAGSSGAVTVSGIGSSWNNSTDLVVGNSGGTGMLTIEDGGAVTNTRAELGLGPGANGTATVTGSGSSWTNTGVLIVGFGGASLLTIEDGGDVTSVGAQIGAEGLANSAAIVTGSGSTWTNSDNLNVGSNATGEMTVTDGGRVTDVEGRIGLNVATSGTVTVSGTGSSWENSSVLIVGYFGTGQLNIEAAGEVTNTQGTIGNTAEGSGTVLVSGTDSVWKNSGDLIVGNAGAGDLKIEDGGRVTNLNGHIAASAGGTGTVTVSGGGSVWELDQLLFLGENGTGTLIIEKGGTVTQTGGSSVGSSAGARGIVTVSGTDSSWTVLNDLDVGLEGAGTLMVEDGGSVRSTAGIIGFLAGGDGTVTVSGAESLWAITNFLSVGNQGAGELIITDGGAVSNTLGLIGGGSGSGAVTVSGAGSSWTNSGALQVGASGTGTLTISDAAAVSAGGVTLAVNAGSTGTLNIGAGLGEGAASAGTLDTSSLAFGAGSGNLTFNHLEPNYVFDVAMTGSAGQGTINVAGGTTVLTADSGGFGGQTNVADHLVVNGSLGGALTVNSGGRLEGIGTVGATTIGAGATLIGRQGEVLNLASLNLAPGANVDVSLGAPGNNALFAIAGDLTLDGLLNISDLGGFGAGVYRLMGYGGALTDNVLDIGSTPDGISASDLSVQTSVAQQVNLVSLAGASLNFWDGPAGPNNGVIEGGSGTWDATNSNWTTSNGAVNGVWNAGFAIFQGAAGTVAVDDGPGAITVEGMQFASDGYAVTGDAIALTLDETVIRVGNGSRASVTTATIGSELTGSGGLVKTDYGALILTGDNSYRGGTSVLGGTLQIASDANLGDAAGGLTLDNGTLATTADIASARSVTLEGDAGRFDTLAGTTLTLDGGVSGSGTLQKQGDGTLVLNGINSYAGNTLVETGTLIGNSATIQGHLINNATTVFDQATNGSFSGDIAGDGAMVKDGVGALTLSGTSVLDWNIVNGRLIGNGLHFQGNVAITGGGTMQFDQTVDADYHGVISGNGFLEKTGSGLLELSENSAGFAGRTDVRAGILRVNGALGGVLNVLSGTQLQGTGSVGSITHAADGIVAPGNSIGTLTVNGNYTGNGGLLEIETVLGGDHSRTDQLVVTGNTAGNAAVRVINRDGRGAQTVEGIKIIEVGGASSGNFSLLGDYVLNGEQVVVAGAYGYALHKNGISTPSDGDWYLRSSLVNPTQGPIFHPGAPVYEAYGQSLQSLNRVGTMQQRVGNRYWSGAGNPHLVQGDRPGMHESAPLPGEGGAAAIDARAIWMRIEGAHARIEPRSSTTAADYDYDVWQLQSGFDGELHENSNGLLIGGITAQYGQVSTDIASVSGKGSIDTDGYGLGGTLTWFGRNGIYADAQTRFTWYDSDLMSGTLGRLAEGNDGFGYALSLEGGKLIDLTPNWTLTPQAQLAYSSVDFDSFTDPFSADVSLDDSDSLIARLGLAAAYQDAWQDPAGRMVRRSLYAIGNLYYEFLDGSDVDLAGIRMTNTDERTWGGIGAGGSYNWADDKYAVYGELSINTSLASFADSYVLNATAGFRIKW